MNTDILGHRAMWQTLHGYAQGRLISYSEYEGIYRASVAGKVAEVNPRDIIQVY